MKQLPLYPVRDVDVIGSLVMLVLAALCLYQVLLLHRRDRENALNTYLMWLVAAIFSFSIFRSLGHLFSYLLVFTGHEAFWKRISPVSGGLNSITFVVIFAVSLFFRSVLVIMNRMTGDRHKIETTSRQILTLNRDVEVMISDRTRAEMALNLAHEIRNPVMIIGGLFRRMCRTLPESNQKTLDYRTEIEQQIGQLESLVGRLEEIKYASRAHFENIELNALVSEVVAIVHSEAAGKELLLVFHKSSTRLPFLGNQHYLRVALLHLLRNSIEACRKGDRIEITAEQTAEGALVRIIDDGPGIPRHVLKHIFEPFYSTRDGSTGLGLPYVQQIIKEHRGTINITSSRGKGVTVTLLLPTHLGELQ